MSSEPEPDPMAKNVVAVSSVNAVTRSSVASSADLEAAMAVLVADGALPTQAHVTTADAALTAFLAANTAEHTGQLVISYDTTLTQNQIHEAVRLALKQIEGIS